jgi:UDP-N-acetylmuramoylalanine-D-glutamate ligase
MTRITTFKNKKVSIRYLTHGTSVATLWLIQRGAQVVVADKGQETMAWVRRVERMLKKSASDGQEYKQHRARLTMASRTSDGGDAMHVLADADDELQLFRQAWPRRIIGVAGKHGKTTAAVWAGHLIADSVVIGHTEDHSPMTAIYSEARVAIAELGTRRPAGLTCVTTDDAVEEEILRIIPSDIVPRWGAHTLISIGAAIRAARLCGVSWPAITRRISTLPSVPYRQEIVHQNRKLTVINDAAAASPESGITALDRWGGPNCILIAGGTNRDLDYRSWAQTLKERIRPTNLILLAGSATDAMRKALGPWGRGIRSYDTLEQAWRAARKRSGLFISSVVLFSPAAKSVDQHFNALVKKEFGT